MILNCLKTNLIVTFFLAWVAISLVACGGSSSPPIVPPPSSSEFVYLSNTTELGSSISTFQIDTAGRPKQIAGSPLEVTSGAYGLIADPQSRFLLVAQDSGWVPASINSSHGLAFNTSATIVGGGWTLMDPLGRFFYMSLATSTTDFNPIHVYSVTADLSFPEVAGSPFDLGIRPVAIDRAGKFLFGFNTAEVATVQIDASGALSKISSVARNNAVNIHVHPSGTFLYVASFPGVVSSYQYDIQVCNISATGTLTPVASETNFMPNATFDFIALHPSGKFVFSNSCGTTQCQLDTLSVDQTTGYIDPKPIFSYPEVWNKAVLDASGARLFAISGKPGKNGCLASDAPGILSVFTITASGQLQPMTTTQTDVCPASVVVTK